MSTKDIFIEAANQLKLLQLFDFNGNSRVIEPYMIYDSAKGKVCFHCYQWQGYSESGKVEGWKNPEMDSFEYGVIVNRTFTPRKEYNPFNEKMFANVHFAIPTIDGRQRTH